MCPASGQAGDSPPLCVLCLSCVTKDETLSIFPWVLPSNMRTLKCPSVWFVKFNETSLVGWVNLVNVFVRYNIRPLWGLRVRLFGILIVQSPPFITRWSGSMTSKRVISEARYRFCRQGNFFFFFFFLQITSFSVTNIVFSSKCIGGISHLQVLQWVQMITWFMMELYFVLYILCM